VVRFVQPPIDGSRDNRDASPLKTVTIAAALAVVAFAVLSFVPWQLRPHTGVPGPLEHVAAYAIAGGLLTFGYGKRSQPFIVVLSLSLYAAILEIAQIWVPGRNPTVIDFAASSAGALIGSALAWIGHGVRAPTEPCAAMVPNYIRQCGASSADATGMGKSARERRKFKVRVSVRIR
jgi:VanZ family protein